MFSAAFFMGSTKHGRPEAAVEMERRSTRTTEGTFDRVAGVVPDRLSDFSHTLRSDHILTFTQ